MQVKKEELELYMEQQTGFKLEKEYVFLQVNFSFYDPMTKYKHY